MRGVMYLHIAHAKRAQRSSRPSYPSSGPFRQQQPHPLVPELVHEFPMELDDAPDPVGAGRQEGGPEVQGAVLLAEARAGHDADASGVEQAQAVELVGGPALLPSGLDGPSGKVNGREEIHGALCEALSASPILRVLIEGSPAAPDIRRPPSS